MLSTDFDRIRINVFIFSEFLLDDEVFSDLVGNDDPDPGRYVGGRCSLGKKQIIWIYSILYIYMLDQHI